MPCSRLGIQPAVPEQPTQPLFVTYDIEELLKENDALSVVDHMTGILSESGRYLRRHEVAFVYAQYAKDRILANGLSCWLDCMFGAGIHEACKGLEEIGAVESAGILRKALTLFPNGAPPNDAEQYTQALNAINDEQRDLIEKLGFEFQNSGEDLDELSFQYLQAHRELFRHSKQQPPDEHREQEAYGIDGAIIPHD